MMCTLFLTCYNVQLLACIYVLLWWVYTIIPNKVTVIKGQSCMSSSTVRSLRGNYSLVMVGERFSSHS